MMEAPNVETVLSAVDVLYNSDNCLQCSEASGWLQKLQTSVHAWKISDDLLALNRDEATSYFAAQTIKSKIAQSFAELPPESRATLRNSLIQHCVRIEATTKRSIVKQLCLAVADFIVHSAEWNNAALDLMNEFGGDEKNWRFLLEVLSLIPEEMSNPSMKCGENRATEITEQLSAASTAFVELLSAISKTATSSGNVELQALALGTLGSWLYYDLIPDELLFKSNLLQFCFSILADSTSNLELHRAASECICAAVSGSVMISAENMLQVKLIYDLTMQLRPAYQQSLADLPRSRCLVHVFTDMSELFADWILENPQNPETKEILELMTACMQHGSVEVVEITFSFWNAFCEGLANKKQDVPLYHELFKGLIQTVWRRCCLDPATEELLDDNDDLTSLREECAELVTDLASLFGFTSIMSQVLSQVTGALWTELECCLHLLSHTLPPEATEENTPQVKNILDLCVDSVEKLSHPALVHTALVLLSEAGYWLKRLPESIQRCATSLIGALRCKPVSSRASKALWLISLDCAHMMTACLEPLVQICQASPLSNQAMLYILMTSAVVLRQTPPETCGNGLKILLELQVSPLRQLLMAGDAEVKRDDPQSDPTLWLSRLLAVLRSSEPDSGDQHSPIIHCKPILLELWPILSATLTKYAADGRIVEKACTCVRYLIRCLGQQASDIVEPLVNQIMDLSQKHPHSTWLYLGSVVEDRFAFHADYCNILFRMFTAFAEQTLVKLSEPNGLINHPQYVDDMFALCTRFLRHQPLAFLRSPTFPTILECAISGMSLDHKEAHSRVSRFISNLIDRVSDKPEAADYQERRQLIQSVLSNQGVHLVTSLLSACINSLTSRTAYDDLARILHALMQIDPPAVKGWLEKGVSALPTHSPGGALNATVDQMTDFVSKSCGAVNAGKQYDALRDFIDLYK